LSRTPLKPGGGCRGRGGGEGGRGPDQLLCFCGEVQRVKNPCSVAKGVTPQTKNKKPQYLNMIRNRCPPPLACRARRALPYILSLYPRHLIFTIRSNTPVVKQPSQRHPPANHLPTPPRQPPPPGR